MPKHVLAFAFDLRAEWLGDQGVVCWHVDAGVGALLLQDTRDVDSSSDEVRVPMEVHDVVEVAWAATFGERVELLAEEFRDRVRQHSSHRKWLVAVLMANLSNHRS